MRRPIALLIALSVGSTAACSASSAPTPLPATPVAPAGQEVAVADASSGAADAATGASPVSSAAAAPSASGPSATMTAQPALEARIPVTVKGLPLEIISLTGEEYLARAPESSLREMIQGANVSSKDVSVAVGVGNDGTQELAIAAFRFPGVAESSLADLFGRQLVVGISDARLEPMRIGGHKVVAVVDPNGATVPTYLNVEGDTARIVQASDDALAKAGVGALP
jgi:hypothetical protein